MKLLYFYVTWYGPCSILGTQMDAVQQKIGRAAEIIKIDVDQSPDLAAEYAVKVMPTAILLEDGEIVGTFIGSHGCTVALGRLQQHTTT